VTLYGASEARPGKHTGAQELQVRKISQKKKERKGERGKLRLETGLKANSHVKHICEKRRERGREIVLFSYKPTPGG